MYWNFSCGYGQNLWNEQCRNSEHCQIHTLWLSTLTFFNETVKNKD